MTDREKELGRALGLVVHDLRNPAATIGANTAFVREVCPAGDADLTEAIDDIELALSDLMAGLEHISWIGRWLAEEKLTRASSGDVVQALRSLESPGEGTTLALDLPDGPLPAEGATAVNRLVKILLTNAMLHARGAEVTVSAQRAGDAICIEVTDPGNAIAPELRERCFTLEGQQALKGRADGRYGRVLGLFAAKLYADAIGATIDAGGEDGAAVFRITLPSASE